MKLAMWFKNSRFFNFNSPFCRACALNPFMKLLDIHETAQEASTVRKKED